MTAKLKIEHWAIDRVLPYAKNARLHSDAQVAAVAKSIAEFGFVNPCLVDADGLLIAGHCRILSAKSLGMETVPVIRLGHLTESQARALRLADNALPEQATWNVDLLRGEIADLKIFGYDIQLLGFPEVKLVQFMATTEPTTEPEIPALPKKPNTKRGDIWQLDSHRILCGDSRIAADVNKLLNGSAINVGFTSPPYAEQRDYDASSGFRPIPPDDYVGWFRDVAANVAKHLAPDGSWFVNIKPSADGLDTSLYVLDLVLAHAREWGWHFATEFCWERGGIPKSVTRRFKNQFEPVYQFARGDWKMRPRAVMHPGENVPIPGGAGSGQTSRKSGQGGRGTNSVSGSFGARKKNRGFPSGEGSQGTNWQANGMPLGIPLDEIGEGMAYPGNRLPTFASTHEATGHAAAFPVGLPAFFVRAYSDAGDAIYDPFLGSGSTLMAAAQNERVGYGMELSPAYVDVAVERWERLTGKKATLIRAKGKGASSRRRPSVSAKHQATSAR